MNNPTPEQLRQQRFSFRGFKDVIMKGLVARYATESGLVGNPLALPAPDMVLPGLSEPLETERQAPKRHIIIFTPHYRKCKHCSTPAAPKRTGFICGDCTDKSHLHPKGCFAAYHKHIYYKGRALCI
ncbi:hypothetical protein PoB_001737400 [Plakobranchus ocellatus]|uniref:PiggyBac transposable element-derived protein 4 C-terminal zinc-ribbon domain-containing protein n=1 Tax=Plakobranchus ocellatus TaxID=259542 RepID=A0AAV3Z6B5_9GAST|nr:hypothetical protein PoB_001737400 [Plakobranchus ocellatus]